MRRVVVVGATGSGKTTFAQTLSASSGLPYTDLDWLHWMDGWQERPLDDFRARIRAITDTDAWIISGNYSKARDLIWSRADTLVWLDYPLWIVMWRLLRRTLKRVITRERLWETNNVERWQNFFSRDKEENIFRWALYSHPRHRATYPNLFTQPEYAHLRVIRLTHPRRARRWLEQIME